MSGAPNGWPLLATRLLNAGSVWAYEDDAVHTFWKRGGDKSHVWTDALDELEAAGLAQSVAFTVQAGASYLHLHAPGWVRLAMGAWIEANQANREVHASPGDVAAWLIDLDPESRAALPALAGCGMSPGEVLAWVWGEAERVRSARLVALELRLAADAGSPWAPSAADAVIALNPPAVEPGPVTMAILKRRAPVAGQLLLPGMPAPALPPLAAPPASPVAPPRAAPPAAARRPAAPPRRLALPPLDAGAAELRAARDAAALCVSIDKARSLIRKAARRYTARSWWADREELEQHGWEIVLRASTTYAPGPVEPGAYLWAALMYGLKNAVWSESAPVSGGKHRPREAFSGLTRAPLDHAPGTAAEDGEPGVPRAELTGDAREEQRYAALRRDVQRRVVALAGGDLSVAAVVLGYRDAMTPREERAVALVLAKARLDAELRALAEEG